MPELPSLYLQPSSVIIVSDYGLDDWAIGVRSPAETADFSPLTSVSRPALGSTLPPIQWVPAVKRGRDCDHSIQCRG
jgi:hypothetical protein